MVMPDEFVPSPPAATVPSLRAVTPVRVRKSGTGLVTMLQLVPFQFSIEAEPKPTAQMSLAETAAIPSSIPLVLGFETTLQLVPFQFSINVSAVLLITCEPAAHTSLLATAATPLNPEPQARWAPKESPAHRQSIPWTRC